MSLQDRLDEMNYARDPRNCKRDVAPTFETPDGVEIKLPTKWVVCDVCNGAGSHVNPSIDCNGISAEDFHDDPDFAEDYASGTYDQTCNKCGGRTTIHEVDIDAIPDDIRPLYLKWAEDEARYEREAYSERMGEIRMGC